MDFQRIYILGAGAIGSVFGAFLSKTHDVTLIGNKAHMEAINQRGLIICGEIEETFHLKTNTEITEIPDQTLIILTTKAYDIAEAVGSIKGKTNNDTVILILQNGLGNEEVARKAAGEKPQILRAVTAMAAEFLEPGKVRFWYGDTIVERTKDGKKIAEMLNQANLKCVSSEKITQELWMKLVLNCVVNPLTAILCVRNNEIISNSLKVVRHQIIRECREVAEAEGISLGKHLEIEIDKKISKYSNISSMHQDLLRRSETEIDFINAKVVRLGRKHDIPTPANEILTSFIRFKEERNELPREN